MRISDWSADVCSSDLGRVRGQRKRSIRASNGPGRCGVWGLRAPARCITVPAGTQPATRGRSLKLNPGRRNRAGQLPPSFEGKQEWHWAGRTEKRRVGEEGGGKGRARGCVYI